jgi:hypothetical protein
MPRMAAVGRTTIMAVAGLLIGATAAHAQGAAPPVGQPAPWSVGVSDEQRARAEALLASGNERFLSQAYAEALEHYRAALHEWDHPAIRFNMARALIHLGRAVEAYENLRLAVAHGAAPLTEQVHAEALSYLKLLEAQIATIVVACTEPGARVTLDGQLLLTCPGQATRRLLPGPHQLVAARPGFLTSTRDAVVMGGQTEQVTVSLIRLEDAAVVTRRWAPWKPWAVLSGGVALVGVGALFERAAREDRDAYNEQLDAMCVPTSCDPDGLGRPIRDLRDGARWNRRYAIGGLVVGGGAIAAGIVGLVLNRSRTELPADAGAAGLAIVPEPGGASVRVGARF